MLLAVDPTEELFDKDRYLFFGTFSGAFKAKHRFTQYFDSQLTLKEII